MSLKGPVAEVCFELDILIGLCREGFLVRVSEELLEMGGRGGEGVADGTLCAVK